MAKTIYKYQLELSAVQGVSMPEGAEILSAANQRGSVCIWAIVDPKAEPKTRLIEVFGTGHILPGAKSRRFIGTVLAEPFVWHVFEILS